MIDVNSPSHAGEQDNLGVPAVVVSCGWGCNCCTQCGDWYDFNEIPKPEQKQ